MMRRWTTILAICLLASILTGPGIGLAKEALVPPKRQARILLKVLTFDYTLTKRTKNSLNIAVLHNSNDAVSTAVANDMHQSFKSLSSLTIQGLPIKVFKLSYGGQSGLKSAIKSRGANAIYICPGLDSMIDKILQLTRDKKLSVLTGVKRYIAKGAPIGVILEGTRPRITVNLPSLKAHGQKLSSNLLQMAILFR